MNRVLPGVWWTWTAEQNNILYCVEVGIEGATMFEVLPTGLTVAQIKSTVENLSILMSSTIASSRFFSTIDMESAFL